MEHPAGSEAHRRYAAEAAQWWERHHDLFFSRWRHPNAAWQEYARLEGFGMMAWLALEAGDTERATGWAHEVARIPEVLA